MGQVGGCPGSEWCLGQAHINRPLGLGLGHQGACLDHLLVILLP